MGERRHMRLNREISTEAIPPILDSLCRDLGICLSNIKRRHLEKTAPFEVASFCRAVLEAEGLNPREPSSKALARDARKLVEKLLDVSLERKIT